MELFVEGLHEEDRQTIEKIARKLSTSQTSLLDHYDEIGDDDLSRLRNVIQAFNAYKKTQGLEESIAFDTTDAGVTSSTLVEFHHRFFASSFISPSRFLVTEETKVIICNINEAIMEWRKNKPGDPTNITDLQINKTVENKGEEELWKRRGKVACFTFIFACLAPFTFILDIGTDLNLARTYFTTGNPWWGTLTLVLVIFPSILTNLISYFFYIDDEDKVRRKPESGWRAVSITHCLQLGLVERYWRIIVKSYQIKCKKPKATLPYKINIAMNLDMAMLEMILGFTENAPQLLLQIYILIRRHQVEDLISSRLQDIATFVSICFSFIAYSKALVDYVSCLRNSKKHKGQLKWYGFIAMWLWRACIFISRVLVLVLFASEYHLWFFLVLTLHFLVVLIMIWRQEVEFFMRANMDTNNDVTTIELTNTNKIERSTSLNQNGNIYTDGNSITDTGVGENTRVNSNDTDNHENDENNYDKVLQDFMRVVIAYMHTFSLFPLEASKTNRWAVKYYVLIALEAVIFSILWFTNNTHYMSRKFEIAGLSAIYICFVMGLLVRFVYQKFLHPKFKRPQTKLHTKGIPNEELCEDVRNEDEDEDMNEECFDEGIHDPMKRVAGVKKQIGALI